jgi:Protein of unknown function (DUF1549)/PDZ domain
MNFPLRNAVLALSALAMLGLMPALARADEQEPAPDKQQYIRRLTLDLTGQPPTPQEVQTFVQDHSPDCYKNLIKRLGVVRAEQAELEKVDKSAIDKWVTTRLDTAYRVALHKQVPAAYLGVGVESPTATIRSQLRLPEGAGLVVNYVDTDGPSKGLVQEHDVLEKLDEQILVNGEQLQTLVRMHKQGETIALTLIREAKPVTVPIKLGEKQVEALGSARDTGNLIYADFQAGNLATANSPNQFNWASPVRLTDGVLASVNGNVVNLNDNTNTARALFAIKDLGDGVTLSTQPVIVPQQTGPLTFDDGKTLVLYYLSPAAKPQAITVLDRASGKMMFSGPAGTEEQWKAVPEDVRQKITTWRDMLKQVNGTPDPATKPAEK